MIFEMTPAVGAGSSTVTLSVSIMATTSSRETVSPSDFNQSPLTTSVIDSPTGGTFSSTASTLLLMCSRRREQDCGRSLRHGRVLCQTRVERSKRLRHGDVRGRFRGRGGGAAEGLVDE